MSSERWTERQGFEVIGRWQRSGQSMASFAREEGLDPQRLRYWRDRAEPQQDWRQQRSTRSARSLAADKLVPGLVVGVGARAPVSVHVGRGVVFEVQSAAEIEPSWLAELVKALEQLP